MKPSPLAVHCTNGIDTYYIDAKYSGIHFLCAACDCLAMTFFGKSKKPYYLLDDAIAWHEKEQLSDDSALKALYEARDRIATGELIEQ